MEEKGEERGGKKKEERWKGERESRAGEKKTNSDFKNCLVLKVG